MPPADIDVTAELVRGLIDAQFPDLAPLPLVSLAHGWDNEMFRLGDALIVRLPRRAVAAQLIDHELAWLPVLAPYFTLPVPVPVRRGAPSDAFPYAWSIVPFLPGRVVGATILDEAAGRTLGHFVRALHVPAPPDAPPNPVRGVKLVERAARTDQWFAKLVAAGDPRAAELRAIWDACVAAPIWDGPPLWLHGDLHAYNVLFDGNAITGVIDFGDITAGDPATDLAVAYMCFDAAGRAAFLDESGADASTRVRGRGWALSMGLGVAVSDDPVLARLGDHTLDVVLESARSTR